MSEREIMPDSTMQSGRPSAFESVSNIDRGSFNGADREANTAADLRAAGLEKQLMGEAIEAYEGKSYHKAFDIWTKLASTNTDAMVNLGSLYAKGKGAAKDLGQAKGWFEKAAELGHDMAAYYLGGMYENGIGVAKDDEKAIAYYRMTAQSGMTAAQVKLGLLQQDKDSREAMKWLIKAAHANDTQAQEMITYVSNAKEAKTLNAAFRSLSFEDQRSFVGDVVQKVIQPLLAADGGGVEYVNYIADTTPQVWLRYLGSCSGCHLGSSSTADMIIQALEETIDKNIVLYLW